MKFRTKFENEGWIGLILSALMIAQQLFLNGRNEFTARDAFYIFPWIVIILSTVTRWLFDRLELDASHLRLRGLVRTKEVSLADVTCVRNCGFTTGKLVLEFTPKAERQSVVLAPKDRIGFISALRQFAPQAAYDLGSRPQSQGANDPDLHVFPGL